MAPESYLPQIHGMRKHRLSAVEGKAMDPQNRVLLEQSFAALTEAQTELGGLAETRTGVYVGCMYQEFTQLQYNLGYGISPAIATGNGISYLVGRVSYAFGLQGPCVSTDTACSSSLVAVDLAHKVRQMALSDPCFTSRHAHGLQRRTGLQCGMCTLASCNSEMIY